MRVGNIRGEYFQNVIHCIYHLNVCFFVLIFIDFRRYMEEGKHHKRPPNHVSEHENKYTQGTHAETGNTRVHIHRPLYIYSSTSPVYMYITCAHTYLYAKAPRRRFPPISIATLSILH